MAGWIPWVKGLTKKPETRGIADRLGIAPQQAAGHIMQFWEWCDDNVPDSGELDGIVELKGIADVYAFIDELAQREGMAKAIEAAGWLSVDEDRVVLPNFLRMNLSTAKSRLLGARRTENHRAKKKAQQGGSGKDAETRARDGPVTPTRDNPVTTKRHHIKNSSNSREQNKKAAADSGDGTVSGETAPASERKKRLLNAVAEAADAAAATGKEREGYHAAVAAVALIAGPKASKAAAENGSITMSDIRNAIDRIPAKYKRSKAAWWIWWVDKGMYEAREEMKASECR